MLQKQLHYAFGSPAIAVQLGMQFRAMKSGERASYLIRIRTDQLIPSGIDCLYPLGFVTRGQAGYAVKIRLLLHAAGIGNNRLRGLFKSNHIDERYRVDYLDGAKTA